MSRLANINSYHVRDLKIIEAGTHHEQYTRPYDVNFSSGTIETLRNRITDEGGKLSTSAIGSTFGTSDGLFVSAAPEVDDRGRPIVADIQHGWDERRYRFVMIFEIDTPSGVEMEIVQGYTSHWEDPSVQSSLLPEDTEFVINGIIKMRQTRTKTSRGYQNSWKAGKSDHVLSSSSGGIGRGKSGLLDGTLFTLRPTELIGVAATDIYRDELESDGGVNVVGVMTGNPTLTSRTNNTATSYASRFFSAIGRSYANEAIGGQESEDNGGFGIDTRVSAARGYLHETGYSEYHFLRALSKFVSIKTNTFTLRDLRRLDPDLPRDVGVAYLLDPVDAGVTNFAEYTSEWYGQDISTQVAAIMGSTVPVLMSRYGIMKCRFTMTNRTVDGGHTFAFLTKPESVMGTEELDVRMINNFEDALVDDCINQISENGQREYELTCSFSLIGDSLVKVSMDGGKEYEYAIPSFSDGILSPQITANSDYRYDFAKHMVGVSQLLADPDYNDFDFSKEVDNFVNGDERSKSSLRGRRQKRLEENDGFTGFGIDDDFGSRGRNSDRRERRRDDRNDLGIGGLLTGKTRSGFGS